jgi:DNA-binding ferritin-like protein
MRPKHLEKDLMQQYISLVKAAHLWFQGAHHSVRGASFGGDHAIILQKIYDGFDETYDSAAEKAVGLYSESVVDPLSVTMMAANILQKYPQPCKLSATGIAAAGLALVEDILRFVEMMFKTLEEEGCLTLGLNNFLSDHADTLEGYVYFLRQRVKADIS